MITQQSSPSLFQENTVGCRYHQSRKATDDVHNSETVQNIYKERGLELLDPEKDEARLHELIPDYNKEIYDDNYLVDYVALKYPNDDHNRKPWIIFIQERFRNDSIYANYNDFTIRYRRDKSHYEDQRKSEMYKLVTAEKVLPTKVAPGYQCFLVLFYGFAKFDDYGRQILSKYVFANLAPLARNFENGNVKPGHQWESTNKIVYGQICGNRDDSSSLIAFRVKDCDRLFGTTKWRKVVGDWGYGVK